MDGPKDLLQTGHDRSRMSDPTGPIGRLVSKDRTEATDRDLALILTFVAGAVNAGGLLAVGQYTSHMSGIVSTLADHLSSGAWQLAGVGATALISFIAGAVASAVLINWGRRHRINGQYAPPLLLEAAVLTLFSLGGMLARGQPAFAVTAVPTLCFVMGLQNATITKVSGARMRTTHVTGMVTDIGIELGKLVYWNRQGFLHGRSVRADRPKLRLLFSLLLMFLAGGVLGARGYVKLGFAAALPLAVLLAALGIAPAIERAILRR